MANKVQFGTRHFHLPASRILRITIGVLLVIFGILGFLPVLGFWMIPLGLLVLSIDIPTVRRWRRQLTVWWYRRKQGRAERNLAAAESAPPVSRRAVAAPRHKGPAETRERS